MGSDHPPSTHKCSAGDGLCQGKMAPCCQSSWKYYPAYTYYILISSTCITIFCQIYRRDYPALVAFILLACLCLFGLLYGLLVHHWLLRHEKSWRRELPKCAIWMFYTAIMFGLVSDFLPFFGLVPAIFLYLISAVGSALLFYVYTIKEYAGGDHSCNKCILEPPHDVDDDKKMKHLDSLSEMV